MDHMPEQPSEPSWFSPRVRLGLLAVLMLTAALFWDVRSSSGEMFRVALVRVGLLAGATWLAWPTLATARWWPQSFGGKVLLSGLAALSAVRPTVFLPMALLIGFLCVFKTAGTRPKSGNPEPRP